MRRLAFVAVAALVWTSAADAGGAQTFQRCAVCHLPSGKGVPGAFPPLAGRVDDLAATPAGRAYLILVPSKGLSGALQVDGVTYRGFMPQQSGLSAADLADLLNYLAQSMGRGGAKGFKPFTASEVERTLKQHASAQPADVAALRPSAPAAVARK